MQEHSHAWVDDGLITVLESILDGFESIIGLLHGDNHGEWKVKNS
nr:hypothetical protein [Pseudomonas aeruginosa]